MDAGREGLFSPPALGVDAARILALASALAADAGERGTLVTALLAR